MTTTIDALDADRQLKAKHRAMWALGNYPELATDLISSLGPVLVNASKIRRGDRVLDVAAGSGNAAIPAALVGATVVASDLTPELFDAGRSQAAARGAALTWETADAEAMAFPDGDFDIVMSCVGVMFAPHHQRAADELTRVCRTGGTIGLLSWTPGGFVGELFGDRVTDVSARTDAVTVDHFRTPADFREYFKSHYGPTIAVYRSIADDPHRVAALDADIDALVRRFQLGDGAAVMEWEYLLLTGSKA